MKMLVSPTLEFGGVREKELDEGEKYEFPVFGGYCAIAETAEELRYVGGLGGMGQAPGHDEFYLGAPVESLVVWIPVVLFGDVVLGETLWIKYSL